MKDEGLAKRVKTLRNRRGFSQEELSEKSGSERLSAAFPILGSLGGSKCSISPWTFLVARSASTFPDGNWDDGAYKPGGNKRLSYTLVSHPRGLEIAAFALLAMEEDTHISMKLEESNTAYRGLSHLEIGDATSCLSYLSESPNPGQDRSRKNADVVTDPKYPLTHRVGLHLRLFKHLADAYADYEDKALKIEKLPEYQDLLAGNIGQFLN